MYEEIYERFTKDLYNERYSTDPEDWAECRVCEDKYRVEDPRWIYPHECAREMPTEEAFVCCRECAEAWEDLHWEEIEDFNYIEEETKSEEER